ncbi:MAG: hypothetical protein WDZ49_06790 [Litorilinea sp.]
MHNPRLTNLIIVAILALVTSVPVQAQVASPHQAGEGIYFSADFTAATNAARFIDLDGSGDSSITGPLPLNQLVYVEAEDRFYGTAFDGAIRRMNADGTGVETLITGLDGANSLRLDVDAGKMYWIDRGSVYLLRGLEVWRANLDGSEPEMVIDDTAGFGQFEELTIDPTSGKLFVVNDDVILWANLDGSEAEVFATAAGGVNPTLSCPTVDATNGKVYWLQDGGSQDNAIYWANLDGTNPEPVIPLASFPEISCPQLDMDAEELLWTDGDADAIKRADLDGSNVEDVLTEVDDPRQLYLGTGGDLYWRALASGGINIMKANRAGGDVEIFVEGLNLLRELTVVPALDKLFWINQVPSVMEMGQINLDGSDAEILKSGPRDIRGIALDAAAGKLYFTSSELIARTNLDGSEMEILLSGLVSAEALALDLVNNKIYWSQGSADPQIRRANLDGTGVEDVFVHSGGGTVIFSGLALDPAGDTLYWTYYIFGGEQSYTGSIWRANLDGSNPAELIPELTTPRTLALDVAGGKLYWSQTTAIQRANLDGSDVENVVFDANQTAYGVALDVPNQHIYWTDTRNQSILRATLAGAEITTRYSGPATPYHLVVVADPPDGETPAPFIYLPTLSAD